MYVLYLYMIIYTHHCFFLNCCLSENRVSPKLMCHHLPHSLSIFQGYTGIPSYIPPFSYMPASRRNFFFPALINCHKWGYPHCWTYPNIIVVVIEALTYPHYILCPILALLVKFPWFMFFTVWSKLLYSFWNPIFSWSPFPVLLLSCFPSPSPAIWRK